MAVLVVEAYIRALQRLVDILLVAVRSLWRGLPGYDRVDEPVFIDAAVPLIIGGEQQVVALTRALYAQVTRSNQIAPVDLNQIIGPAARNGVEPEVVYQRPFMEVRKELKNGRMWIDAVQGGENRAMSAVETDMQLVKRKTAQAIQDVEDRIFGFRRVAHPDACAFCKLLASKGGAYVKRADAFPIHSHCKCTLVPLVEPHPGAVFLPDGTRIRHHQGGEIIEPETPDEVAVHEHQELGAVVYAPEYHFTALDAA